MPRAVSARRGRARAEAGPRAPRTRSCARTSGARSPTCRARCSGMESTRTRRSPPPTAGWVSIPPEAGERSHCPPRPDARLARQSGRAVREPGASPGRSRRCEGRCPAPRSHWPPGREGGGGGAPSQKTCRPPDMEPLAEGGFVLGRSLTIVAVLACAAVVAVTGSAGTERLPQRIVSLSPTATESLFSIGAGRQVVAVDDQSDYPKRAPRTKLSGI